MFFLILHSFEVIIKLYQMNGMSWSLKHHSPGSISSWEFCISSVPSLDLSDHPELVAFESWIGYESWKLKLLQFLWNIPNIFVHILWLCEAYPWSISQLAFTCRRQMVVSIPLFSFLLNKKLYLAQRSIIATRKIAIRKCLSLYFCMRYYSRLCLGSVTMTFIK